MMKLALSALMLASFSFAGVASAEEGTAAVVPAAAEAPKSMRGIIVLPPTELTSPPMRPLATVDIARIPARLTLTVLRQPLLERIEASVFTDQF